jgi:hypothetical protein
MHGFQNPNIIDHPIEDGRFPSSRNRRHSAKPEPRSAVSALAGECRAIARWLGRHPEAAAALACIAIWAGTFLAIWRL